MKGRDRLKKQIETGIFQVVGPFSGHLDGGRGHSGHDLLWP